ncbi:MULTISPECIES: DNA polymerase III subunit epsilon [unclassified Bradyrhizobium]|uniref:DNA polymerase III subunit epsilon n=1 Tax=unclassified Bradyrhizobium TaxID=2631580 RepID=UPI0029165912|nr:MULTISPECIES: DNA polymerase III subunit epsilon [unclassified Bradyrhizobium]
MKREIILDTETTGLDRKTDRIVEIGCVEAIDLMPTGKTFHKYINPTHPVHKEAFKVHGLSNEFLKKFPTFRRQVNQFLTFIEGATLVAHNAGFDVGMINAELDRLDLPPLQNEIVDSLALAREKRPGARHTLDSLCKTFGINLTKRDKHGALLDAQLLAEVYCELRGGRQMGMSLDLFAESSDVAQPTIRPRPTPLAPRVTDEDRALHAQFISEMKDAIWGEYRAPKLENAA